MKSLKELIKGLSRDRAREAFIYTFIIGVVTHGFTLFNKLSWHDDSVHGFSKLAIEKPIAMGRWFRVLLSSTAARLFGGINLSLPLFNGTLCILYIALAAYLVIEILDIKEKIYRVFICGILVSFPVVTSIVAYMFTAPYYFFGLFLSVCAVYIVKNGCSYLHLLLGAVCICLSLGIYQAFYAVPVSFLVILLVLGIARDEFESAPALIRKGLYYLAACIAGMVLYIIVSRLCMKAFGLSATSYQGFSTIGKSGIRAYLHAIKRIYKGVFQSYETAYENLYPYWISSLQWILVIFAMLISALMVLRQLRKNWLVGILMSLLLLGLPACFNVIYLFSASSPDSTIHTLMLYGQVMQYVFIVGAVSSLHFDRKQIKRMISVFFSFVLMALLFSNVYFDNTCYLKAAMVQQQSISNLTVLVARIKSMPGYNDEMPVCLIVSAKRDATVTKEKWYSSVSIKPFDNHFLMFPYHFDNGRNLRAFLKDWCGFAPKYVSDQNFRELEEVEQMPDYPDEGSIRIINDTIVVKI